MPADALTPSALWSQAHEENPGDIEGRVRRYNELMVEHGHLVCSNCRVSPCFCDQEVE